jgi:hypothetical protein
MMDRKNSNDSWRRKQTKDYIFIDDAVDATLLCFKKTLSGEINIAAGKEVSVNEIFARIKK